MNAGIVGAGILGRLLAFYLQRMGWQITLFDRDGDNCSMAAAGLLNPISELEKNDKVIFQLGIEAIQQHWPDVLNDLPFPIYFRQWGSFILSHPNDQSELVRFIKIIADKIDSKKYCHQLTSQEINELEPDLKKFSYGYYFPHEGQIDSQMLLTALETYLSNKIDWLKNSFVLEVVPKKIILQDGKSYHFDWVFDCRGLGAKSIFSNLRGVRGELIWLHAPEIMITRPIRFLHPRYSLYLVPRPKQIYLLGASEIETEDNSPISVRTVLELLTAVYYLQSKFAEARIIKTVTQIRPTLSHHLPRIKYSQGFIAINGLYRHGFLLAPSLIHEIVQFIHQGSVALRYPQLWEKYND